jgi:6-phosphogluconolactonase
MIRVLSDAGALARAVADLVAARAADATRARGRFTLALAGGETPRSAYTLLADGRYSGSVDWTRVHVLWGDERCVPPDDPRSNYRMARVALLSRVPIPPQQVHRIRGEDEPHAAAAAYEALLRGLLGTAGPDGPPERGADLVLLGMGSDGHTASLFPGLEAVHERVRWVVAERGGAGGLWRVTLTPVVLNAARAVVFMVLGAGKAGALREVLEGPLAPDRLPAQAIRPARGHLIWLVDSTAATALRRPPPAAC